MTNKVYAAFFMGQGGSLFSLGIQALAARARNAGAVVDVFTYTDYVAAGSRIEAYRRQGHKIVLLGYSAGCSTIGYMQNILNTKNDLLISLAQSELTINYPIKKANTKRSVLWHGNFPLDFLSSAGTNLGYDDIEEMSWPHILADWAPDVQSGVLAEIAALQKAA